MVEDHRHLFRHIRKSLGQVMSLIWDEFRARTRRETAILAPAHGPGCEGTRLANSQILVQ